MNSPLAISNIVISRSVGGSSGSDALDSSSSSSPSCSSKYTGGAAVPSGNAIPLLLRVRRVRILAAATASCVLVAGAMFVLSRGVTVASVRVGDGRTLDDVLQTASDYNLYAGMGAALFVRPLLVMVASVAPAALLCFCTGAVMQDQDQGERGPSAAAMWTRRIATFLLYNGLLWLLSSGFHAANTHARVSSIRSAVMGDAELTSAAGPAANVSSADSILRTVLYPSQAAAAALISSAPECSLPSPQQIPAQVGFAFPSASWMASVIPSGPVLTASNSVSVPVDSPASSSGGAGTLPMDAAAARTLTGFALRAADDFFRPRSSAPNASLFSVAASEDDAGTLVDTVRSVLASAISSRPHWRNLSLADATLQLVNVSLSDAVHFQAATLELPTSAAFLSRALEVDANATTTSVEYGDADASNDASNDEDVVFEINAKEECGRRACVVSARGASPTTAAADWGSQVRVLPICATADGEDDAAATMAADGQACDRWADGAVLVLSFASRVQGDAIASTTTAAGNATLVALTNARKVYQVTVGRLSWSTSALATDCDASSDCSRLAFPLTSAGDGSNSVVVVGASRLPSPAQLASYAPSPLEWTPLVLASAREVDAGGVLKSDLVFPRNFADASAFEQLGASQCETERGAFLDLVERGHYFSERSLHPAVLSGLFWLLQGGEASQSTASDGTSSAATASDASSVVDIELAVPHAAAVLTYAGCAALWLMAVAVFLGGRRREADIERRFKPAHLARALLDNDATQGSDVDAFGGFLGGGSGPFSRRVLHINLLHVGGRFLANSELLGEFELGGVALRHRGRPSDVLIVPATQSATASYLSAVGENQQPPDTRQHASNYHRQVDQFQGQVI